MNSETISMKGDVAPSLIERDQQASRFTPTTIEPTEKLEATSSPSNLEELRPLPQAGNEERQAPLTRYWQRYQKVLIHIIIWVLSTMLSHSLKSK